MTTLCFKNHQHKKDFNYDGGILYLTLYAHNDFMVEKQPTYEFNPGLQHFNQQIFHLHTN